MKKLVPLDEFNAFSSTFGIDYYKTKHPNGIACPRCGKELVDSDDMILTSFPPKKNVECPICSFHGFRNC